MESLVHLRSARCSLVLGFARENATILHWGAPLGEFDEKAFLAVADDGESFTELDAGQRQGLWAENARGNLGAPTISAHRDGRDFSAQFTVVDAEQRQNAVHVIAEDEIAGLRIESLIELTEQGVVLIAHSLENLAPGTVTVDGLMTWLPLPDRAAEILDFTGRWVKERQPQRMPINVGTWVRESREGRTGHDATIVQLALTPGTDFSHGEAWSVGLQWSGNTRNAVERTFIGRTRIGAGELLLPGEVRIEQGRRYDAPQIAAAYSNTGIDGVTAVYLDWLRARPHHPRRPRPLTLNVWEAVWFDHDLDRLTALADAAQRVGVERFVLDDGWFHLRRDDYAGLGDWWVDPAVWPEGLGPLIDVVTSRGMEFGLWFEPEMVNADSDLFRAHPEWILHAGNRMPPEKRHQQVLNIANPDAWQYLYDRMHALLSEYDIAYIKWDHNRTLIEPGDGERAIVREQTLAFYRLVDALKAAHPGLEIESCASGGGRIDLGAIEHCDRFWTSDCNEALERQQIQRWTGSAIPPELLGTHIGPPVSHSTGRAHSLGFRATTALLGHAGIEWDISSCTEEQIAQLRDWANYYKANRELLHTGTVVRVDGIDESAYVHGVVAKDRSRAIFIYAQLTAARASKPDHFVLQGLDPHRDYTVRLRHFADAPRVLESAAPAWADGVSLPGDVLMSIGLRPQRIYPEEAFVIELDASVES